MNSPFPLFDRAAIRTLEAQGIADAGDDGFVLMARAGHAAWRCLLKHGPQARRILVVCGAGNNGGDGYVLAKHALQAGRMVHVVAFKAAESALAQRAAAEFMAAGGVIQSAAEPLPDADVLVDALFGIGLSRAPDAESAALIAAINQHPAAVLALDVPSGLDAASGNRYPQAVKADCTLQFLARHQGLRTGAALDVCGHLELATLELPHTLPAFAQPSAWAYRADALRDFFPLRARDSHKGRNGHVLCIGGNHGSGGAILLAAQAALRSGAGLVSVATRSEHVTAALARLPEAMVHAVDDATYLEMLIARADVIAIGPGLAQDAWAMTMLNCVLKATQPRVWDADALNLLAKQGVRLQPADIVTPHPGEAARLLAVTPEDVHAIVLQRCMHCKKNWVARWYLKARVRWSKRYLSVLPSSVQVTQGWVLVAWEMCSPAVSLRWWRKVCLRLRRPLQGRFYMRRPVMRR